VDVIVAEGLDLVGAFVLGLAQGAGPCLGICAPIIFPLTAATAGSAREGFIVAGLAALGRLLAYVVLGAGAGLLGGAVQAFAEGGGAWHVYMACGFASGVLGGYYLVKAHTCACIELGVTNPFILGVLLGLAPCAPLTLILVQAFATGSAFYGVVLVIVFGIASSLPLLLGGGFVGHLVRHIQTGGDFSRNVQRVSGVLLIMAGAKFLLMARAVELVAGP